MGYIINLEGEEDENGDPNTDSHWCALYIREYPKKKKELYTLASKIALSRVQMGNHYPSDIEVGKDVGNLIADKYLELRA